MTDAAPAPESTDDTPSPAQTGFDDLGLSAPLRRAVAELGFERPSPIQVQTIPALLSGRDVIGVAQTGTGKTAAFGLPLLSAMDPAEKSVQAIVLTPTRELAMQVADAITSFATSIDGLDVVAVYGGSPYGPQEKALRRGVQVVVGTPGRVMDHMKRSTLRLDGVRFAVLDEADEMLRMGFAEDVEEILSHSPATRQVALFSATMPPAIQKVASEHMDDPVRVSVSPQSSTVDSVHQSYAVVPFRHRTGALARVLATTDAEAAIVFVRTRAAAEEVGSELVSRGLVAASISGDVPQKEREKIVERLRDGSLKVLVATDVAARGLDVEKIGLVVNFDVPREPEAYVHRIGRTGRAGRSGQAITFIGPHERRALRAIEKATRQTLEEAQVPSPRDVSKHRLQALLGKAPERLERGRLELYRELIGEFLAEKELDAVELAVALAAMGVGDDGPGTVTEDEEFTGATLTGRDRGRDRGEDERRPAPRTEKGYTAYRIGVGHTHGARPPAIVGAITGEGNVNGKDVGKISIFGSFSLVEIRGGLSSQQLAAIGSAKVGGRELRIAEDTGPRRDRRPAGDRPFRRDGDRSFTRDGDRGFRREADRSLRRDGAKPWHREGGGSRFDSKRRSGSFRRHEGNGD
ncbi:DEAD/DEAH box helicase [Brachybacterium sp. p3-SID1565]|uniref:DEAD/DEAH box helicase n=1 Tax=unclassified Brachybacterium TaxID=2623841 RepID=UPI0021AAE16D|nr:MULTISPECIES: DEAD/DEAH box helicase [unclassified Brachybacterium]MCT1386038.1 DEAD/DEAH box helicase [Brachybacterium sp. p3-SID1565]MCT1776431.1 DEAD/DEAH box helicase [Brachybacterium sp. p3-SID957]